MLETIREYAAARLDESGESEEIHGRHAAYFERYVEELHSLLTGPRAPEAMTGIHDDWDNVDAVARRRIAAGDFAAPVRLASLAWRYVWLYDRVREATTWMPLAYEVREQLEPRLRGELCRIWGSSLYQFGEYEQARAALEEAVEVLGKSGPPDREAWACTILSGLLPHFEDDLGHSVSEVSRAVEIFRAERNDFGLATSLALLGTLMTLIGRTEEGRAQLEESVEAAEKLRLPSLIGANLTLRALGLLSAGDVGDARRLLESAAEMPLYLEGTAYCLEGLAAVSLAEGDEIRAATAFGAAESLRERTGIRMWPILRMAFGPAIDALDAAGPEAQAARYEGSHMSPQHALARVVAETAVAA